MAESKSTEEELESPFTEEELAAAAELATALEAEASSSGTRLDMLLRDAEFLRERGAARLPDALHARARERALAELESPAPTAGGGPSRVRWLHFRWGAATGAFALAAVALLTFSVSHPRSESLASKASSVERRDAELLIAQSRYLAAAAEKPMEQMQRQATLERSLRAHREALFASYEGEQK